MPPKGKKPAAKPPLVTAVDLSLTPLDADGQPTGLPVPVPDAVVSLDVEPVVEQTGLEDFGIYGPGSDVARRDAAIAEAVDVQPPVLTPVDPRIPIPTAVIDRWFPAFVRWPHEDQPLTSCKVLLTPQGLYVYTKPAVEPETFASGARPARYAAVDFEKTGKPPIGTVARNAGIVIVTAVGQRVIVQPTGGCGCGNRLKRWTPTWARNVISWETGVELAAVATAGR